MKFDFQIVDCHKHTRKMKDVKCKDCGEKLGFQRHDNHCIHEKLQCDICLSRFSE